MEIDILLLKATLKLRGLVYRIVNIKHNILYFMEGVRGENK